MSRLTRFSVSRPDLSSRNASVELRWPMEHGNPIRRLVFGHYFLFYSYTGRHECSRKNLERTIGMSSFAGHTKYRVAQSRLAAQIKVGENRNSSCEFSGGCGGDNIEKRVESLISYRHRSRIGKHRGIFGYCSWSGNGSERRNRFVSHF